jgi:hypothetical protein
MQFLASPGLPLRCIGVDQITGAIPFSMSDGAVVQNPPRVQNPAPSVISICSVATERDT